jgi:crossover junction endodeoxyribonuclease RuvC
MSDKLVLGIDVGYDICGWAVVSSSKSQASYNIMDFGVIQTSVSTSLYSRMNEINNGINDIISSYKINDLAIESLFYFKNQKTFTSVLQVRGVIINTCFSNGIKVYEYTPLQVKQSITGYGRSKKSEVQNMVKYLYKLVELPKPDDAADALAISYCHLNSITMLNKINNND